MEEKEMSLKEYQEWREEQDEKLKDAVRLTAEAAKQLSDAIVRAETTPCIPFDGKMLTIAEAIKTLRNGNGGTVMLWRKCSDAQPKTPRNALVLVDGRFAIAYWNGYEWQPDDYRIEIQPEYWQNLPPLPAEMMQNGE